MKWLAAAAGVLTHQVLVMQRLLVPIERLLSMLTRYCLESNHKLITASSLCVASYSSMGITSCHRSASAACCCADVPGGIFKALFASMQMGIDGIDGGRMPAVGHMQPGQCCSPAVSCCQRQERPRADMGGHSPLPADDPAEIWLLRAPWLLYALFPTLWTLSNSLVTCWNDVHDWLLYRSNRQATSTVYHCEVSGVCLCEVVIRLRKWVLQTNSTGRIWNGTCVAVSCTPHNSVFVQRIISAKGAFSWKRTNPSSPLLAGNSDYSTRRK